LGGPRVRVDADTFSGWPDPQAGQTHPLSRAAICAT
jgi:hypothetical protein